MAEGKGPAVNDYLIRGVLKAFNVRFVLAGTTRLVQDAVIAHDTDPAAAQIFSDALTAAALLAPLLTGEERYTIRWEYPGTAGVLLADVNAAADVRGLPSNPHLMAEGDRADKEKLFGDGDGMIAVTKSVAGKVLNTGQTKAPLAQPSADIAFFLSLSDQVESEMVTVTRFNADPANPVHTAGGMLLQAMPDCDLERFEVMRRKLGQPAVKELLLNNCSPLETRLRRILAELLAPDSLEEADVNYEFGPEPGFRCSCSEEKMRQAMLVLGMDDLKQLFTERDSVAVCCNFCRRKYTFTQKDFFST